MRGCSNSNSNSNNLVRTNLAGALSVQKNTVATRAVLGQSVTGTGNRGAGYAWSKQTTVEPALRREYQAAMDTLNKDLGNTKFGLTRVQRYRRMAYNFFRQYS